MPAEGRIVIGQADDAGGQGDLRRHIAYLPQDLQDPPFVSARELVSLGRFRPDRSLGWRVSAEDKEVVEECLARCLADSLADRPFDHLSGGEKQRYGCPSAWPSNESSSCWMNRCRRLTIRKRASSSECWRSWHPKARAWFLLRTTCRWRSVWSENAGAEGRRTGIRRASG